MVDRIREVLSARKLTPTQFADLIGIARPIISHILSGRNKPSLEVVQKIIAAFPELSLPWLLNGVGSMLATAVVSEPVNASTSSSPARRASAKGLETARPASARSEPTPESVATEAEASASKISPLLPPLASTNPSVPPPAPDTRPLTPLNSYAALESSDNGGIVNRSLPVAELSAAASPTAPTSNATPPIVAPFLAAPDKAIRRIVIFYQDGTFTDYRPEHT